MAELVEKVEEKSKEKDRFFACVSHELRNPLNSLLASVEILPKTAASKQGELLSSAKSCGETLLNLIGNILDVSKIKDQKMEVYYTDADITEIIDKAMMMHKVKAQKKGLYFKLIKDQNIPPCVKLDPAKIMQVLTNLISNSIKFTEMGIVVTKLTWIPIQNINYLSTDFQNVIEETIKSSNREYIVNSIDEQIGSGYFDKNDKNINNKLDLYKDLSREDSNNYIGKIDASLGPKIKYSGSITSIIRPQKAVNIYIYIYIY